MNTGDIMAALALRYPSPAWAFIPQVRNGTGYIRGPRTADALAMSLWPSRGLELHGFEVKASRSDWLRELKDPAKADDLFAFCDRWWLVVGDEKILAPGELPPTWGLIAPRGAGLVAKVEAPKLDATPPDKLLLAAILRRVADTTVPADDVAGRLVKAREEGKQEAADAIADAKRDLGEYVAMVATFEKESGVKVIDKWQWGNIGRAVNTVISHGPEKVRRDLEAFQRFANNIAEECARQLADENTGLSQR